MAEMWVKLNVSKIFLGLILILGLVLRLWGSTFGLPNRFAPDEAKKVHTALTYEEKGFRPPYKQPSFLNNSLYLLFRIANFAKPPIERSAWYRRQGLPGFERQAFFLWLGRCWMALLGAITIFLVYLLGKGIWDEWAGVFAAAFYAFSPLPVVSAHYIKEDTPFTGWATVTLILCLSIIETGRRRDYLWAGFASGATFSTKYSGAITFFLLIVSHFLRGDQESPSSSPHKRCKSNASLLFLLVISSIVGFAVISPTLFLSLPKLIQGVVFQGMYALRGHHDRITVGALENLLTFYLRKALLPGITLPLLVGALLGIGKLWKKKRAYAIVMGAWIGGYYLLAELSPSKPYPFYSRYILPIVPGLCATAGILASVLFFSAKARHGKTGITRILNLLCLVAMILPPAYLSTRYVFAMVPDTRDLARQWILAHVPKGSVILTSGKTEYVPVIDTKDYQREDLTTRTYEKYKSQSMGKNVICILSGFEYDRYLENWRIRTMCRKRPECIKKSSTGSGW